MSLCFVHPKWFPHIPSEKALEMNDLVVLRCTICGDTFSIHADDPAVCPSCGGDETDPATEPLL